MPKQLGSTVDFSLPPTIASQSIDTRYLPSNIAAAVQGSGLTHSGVGQTINSVVVTTGMRILDTATGATSGLWVAASGAWTRPVDFATGADARGKLIPVGKDGAAWICVASSVVTIDTTSQTWQATQLPIGFTTAVNVADGTATKDYHTRRYGAKCNGKWTTVSTTSGSAAITAPAGTFTSTAVDGNKFIGIDGAGAAGVFFAGQILSVQSDTQATLGANASTTVSSSTCFFATDDTTAIRNTVTAASANVNTSGLPSTVYHDGLSAVNGTIATDWNDKLSLRGNGPGRSSIVCIGGGGFTLINGGSRTASTPYDRVLFADIELDGRYMTESAGYQLTHKGIFLQYATNLIFQNIRVMNFPATGIGCDFLVNSYAYGSEASGNGRTNNGTTNGGGNGFGIGSGGSDIENFTLVGCIANNNKNFGIYSEINGSFTGRYMTVVGCSASGNKHGMGNTGNERMNITGCRSYGNVLNGIFIGKGTISTAAGKEGHISGNECYDNGQDGIGYDATNTTGSGVFKFTNNRCASNVRNGMRWATAGSAMPSMNATDNEFHDNGASGFHMYCTTTTLITDPHISNNRSWDNGKTDVSGSTQGFRIECNTSRMILANNTAYDTAASTKLQNYGVNLVASYTHTDAKIADNNLTGNGTAGMAQSATLTTTAIRTNIGYLTAGSGKAVFSGDGSTTAFTFAHGLAIVPASVLLTPASAAAAALSWVSIGTTTVTVNFLSAPAAGANNIVLNWTASDNNATVKALLDTLTGITGAYSMQRLLTGYTGHAIKVRRASDAATLDFDYLVSGLLDTSSITTWLAGSDGFIDTWYDQSGQGLHLQQTTTAAQFRIALAGVVDSINGKPAAFVANATSGYTSATFTSYVGTTICGAAVATLHNTVSSGRVLTLLNASDTDLSNTSGILIGRQSSNQTWGVNRNSSFVATVGGTYDQLACIATVFDGTNVTIYRNGIAGTPAASSAAFAVHRISLCADSSPTVFVSPTGAYIGEAIFKVAAGAWTTEVASIHTDQSSRWATP